MWDFVEAILSGLSAGLSSGSRLGPRAKGPSLAAHLVIAGVLMLLAVGFVYLSFVPDVIWSMLLIQLLALLLVLVAIGEIHAGYKGRRRDRAAGGRCIACGYDLTANVSGTCPECGTPTSGFVR